MGEKLPQSNSTLADRLEQIAKFFDSVATIARAESERGIDDQTAIAMRARANTCWQVVGRLRGDPHASV